ncbi:alpha/beta hydrolase [Eikenella sp. Marseille-P7795]|uniref:RBBP9/YdeN family alpha/beta hydrolase n=1 Tax=Eikenella sp. Marseille-P7795 TaxID=2866577 RepID=UPI001CE3C4E8|nr:alpha/beta hydrolase [Eikenella sp. Marseille-P7795]
MNRRQFCLTAALALSACALPRAKQTARTQRAFIIHGWGATPDDHWFARLSAGLKARGYNVDVPALPDSRHADFQAWQRTLAEHIGMPQPDDLFIAHSLGNISLLHYLSHTRPPEIGGLVLVSGFAGKLPRLPEIEGYSIDRYVGQARLDLPAVRRMTANIACIISANDPIVAPAESMKLANALGARVITVPDAGHFLASDGFTELPQAWQALDGFAK